jgi:hypothetical protein
MADSNSLFSLYEELVQDHSSQFDPQIASLQELVIRRMQAIRDAEQSLVEAQAIPSCLIGMKELETQA